MKFSILTLVKNTVLQRAVEGRNAYLSIGDGDVREKCRSFSIFGFGVGAQC